MLELLGNVTFLERPFHPTTLVSLARAALRARMRQYDARTRMEDIREGEGRLRLALVAGGLGAWSIELKTDDLTVSPEGNAHYGRGPDDTFTYQDLLASIHPGDRPRMLEAVRRAIETRTDYDIEYRTVWPDGSTHWVQVNGRLEFGSNGKPARMVGVTRDVTVSRRRESRRAALLALGDGLRQLVEPADMSYLAAKILGETIDVSRAGYGIIDPVAETIRIDRDWNQPGTRSLAGVLHFRDYGSYIENLKRGETVAIADARTDPRTAETAAALEAIHARAVLNMPLIDHENFVALLYLNHRDVHEWTDDELAFVRDVADRTQAAIERRVAEAALARLAESLEQQVAERTREFEAAQEQLRQAQKMEAVGQLTGGIAHDFNNLLTGISGSMELIARRIAQGRTEEVGKYLEMAQTGVTRAAALTHRLLAFSRRQTLDPKPSDIGQLVRNTFEFLSRTVGPSIEIKIGGDTEVWTTLLDSNQFENALLNASINARDAMPDGGTIRIETRNRTLGEREARELGLNAGDFVVTTISDTGSGMSPETIERAFDPFYTTKPLGEGTGLGLSMIYGFVRQSGGQVRIQSTPGKGTTLALYFPRAFDTAGEFGEAHPADAARSPDGHGTVLVVEDEAIIRTLITDALAERGFQTLEAGDGHEALTVLETAPPLDLLITDVGLPKGMNGRQLAEAARANAPDLKILFITGYAENAVIGGRQLEPGMHLLTKPFEIETLAARVQELTAA